MSKRVLTEGLKMYLRDKMSEALKNGDHEAFLRYSREYCIGKIAYVVTEDEAKIQL